MVDAMPNSQRKIAVNSSAPVCPETVQELIDCLAQYPLDSKLTFEPLTLWQVKDRSGVVQFVFNEIEGVDFKIVRND